MKFDRPQICEVKVEGFWKPVSLEDARRHHQFDRKRCPVCHGQMMTYGAYTATGHTGLAHRRKHSGCPLQPDTYLGVPTPHPQAIS